MLSSYTVKQLVEYKDAVGYRLQTPNMSNNPFFCAEPELRSGTSDFANAPLAKFSDSAVLTCAVVFRDFQLLSLILSFEPRCLLSLEKTI